ncbi:hypothetical protein [Neokomagataea anthophila]|uniref:Uncharacterized protein n=1 Tax=Neokomagataea anthophila TaxID=2826925 RepID=A0ABS5E9B9_9PROT|nr:hypothetical protein [Neokomagataea anthophila]MBR0560464.1 hypothetical protein [Neokomagataea anthophila]
MNGFSIDLAADSIIDTHSRLCEQRVLSKMQATEKFLKCHDPKTINHIAWYSQKDTA